MSKTILSILCATVLLGACTSYNQKNYKRYDGISYAEYERQRKEREQQYEYLYETVSEEDITSPYDAAPEVVEEDVVESVNSSADSDYAELVEVEACCAKGTCNTVAGTIMGKKSRPKIVRIGPNNVEVNAAAKCAILLKNVDKPGMVGVIGTILGENGCNIANMTLSRDDDGGNALSIFELDAIPSAEAVAALKNHKCVQDVKVVDFSA